MLATRHLWAFVITVLLSFTVITIIRESTVTYTFAAPLAPLIPVLTTHPDPLSPDRPWNSSEAMARAMAADRWLTAKTLDRETDIVAPSWWVQFNRTEIAAFARNRERVGAGNSKQVFAKTIHVDGVGLVDVVEKRSRLGKFSSLHVEALYLEYLRGEPGIPLLYGAFFGEDGQLHTVVQRAGNRFAGYYDKTYAKKYQKSVFFKKSYWSMAFDDPVGLARAWIRLFRSFAERGGFLLHDFTVRQFTHEYVDGDPVIYLVDGPQPSTGPLADALRNHKLPKVSKSVQRPPSKCNVSADCLGLKSYHCCCSNPDDGPNGNGKLKGNTTLCDPRSSGAPESHGACGRYGAAPGSCAPFTARGHLYDLGGKSWILPALVDAAAQMSFNASSRTIEDIVRRCTRPEPSDRPTFDELLALLSPEAVD